MENDHPFCVSASAHAGMRAALSGDKLSVPWGALGLVPTGCRGCGWSSPSEPPSPRRSSPTRPHCRLSLFQIPSGASAGLTGATCSDAAGKGFRLANEPPGAPLGPSRGPIPARYRCVGPRFITLTKIGNKPPKSPSPSQGLAVWRYGQKRFQLPAIGAGIVLGPPRPSPCATRRTLSLHRANIRSMIW